MADKPPGILHHPKHHHDDSEHAVPHPHHTTLPIIPDLRFEQSYLRSIQPYVKIQRTSTAGGANTSQEHDENRPGLLHESGYEHVSAAEIKQQPQTSIQSAISSEVIHVQWGRVAWVTTRDQVISPLLQGALWAIASYFLSPISARLGTRVGTFAHSHLSPSKEGTGVGWLRNWASGLGFGSPSPPIRP
ncbi:hypothetical protein Hypma_002161 [Hypsizygus marmoreus]|uniref:Uncharacterized protein n=1 Tax=Hypsizygus marmoreus TaxID=39966 RepID=A0A369K1W7_HYPMA|nr:hypothetical protein Hypma_002161 [Hypsizygus marmoreus]